METVTWNSLTYKIINISESEDAREIVATCKNKWKSPWLEEKDKNGDYLSTNVRKINISGSVFCIYCIKPLVYGITGKKDLFMHATKSIEHLSSKRAFDPPHSYHFIGGSLQAVHQMILVPALH